MIQSASSTKKQFQTGDVVVSRLRSYLKEIAIVTTPANVRSVGSSEFFVLRPRSNKVSSELLLVYLRSSPVQKILHWCQIGSNHPRIEEKEILTLKLPDCILGMEVQDDINRLIQSGIDAYREAKNLLEQAKRKVETIIESEVAYV